MRSILAVTAILLAAPLLAQNERILLPVFTEPVDGAFGSKFYTSAIVANTGDTVLTLLGLTFDCGIQSFCHGPDELTMEPGRVFRSGELIFNGTPGRFVLVPKNDLPRLSMNLRVQDNSREELNFGTEMPIVRESEFVTGRIVFPMVHVAYQYFRNTLRIYAERPVDVLVTVGEQPPVRIALTGATDLFDPAYGVFTDFPHVLGKQIPVIVEVDPSGLTTPVPIWAFITVTNNQTQVITTITPRP